MLAGIAAQPTGTMCLLDIGAIPEALPKGNVLGMGVIRNLHSIRFHQPALSSKAKSHDYHVSLSPVNGVLLQIMLPEVGIV